MSIPGKSLFEEPIFDRDAGFAQPGQTLCDGRYKIVRKIGYGRDSSTWLVLDNFVADHYSAIDRVTNSRPPKMYHALKVLTTHATTLHKNGTFNELEYLRTVTRLNHLHFHLPRLLDHFEHSGPYRLHLCFVLELLGETVGSFRLRSPSHEFVIPVMEDPLSAGSTQPQGSNVAHSLPVRLVRKIITQILDALEGLHAANIIHTDVNQDHFVFVLGNPRVSDAVIQQDILTSGVFLHEDTEYPIFLSQPLPYFVSIDTPSLWVETWNIYLIDLGRAQKVVDKPRTRKIGSCALRAPEVLLKIPYDTKVDIWALGCTTFELLTGMRLFDPQSSGEKQSECGDSGDESSSDEEDDPASGDDAISQSVDDRDESWSRGEDHLAKMIEVTGEVFPSDLASTSSLGRKYFDDAGNLKRRKHLHPVNIDDLLRQHGVESEQAANFIRECLHLDPKQRKSAEELSRRLFMATLSGAGQSTIKVLLIVFFV